jgi:hypothetical protein
MAVIKEKEIGTQECRRCGGFMVGEEAHEADTVLCRCVMCGERVDPVILQHRQKILSRKQAEKLFARAQKAPLN